MALSFSTKIKELEQEKSKLDLTFLEAQKKVYEQKMYEILDNQNDETDEKNAISELNKIKSYRSKIKETENKIQNNPKFLEDVDKKISFYKERRERVKNIPLYKDTEEGIIEVLGSDSLYQYAKEIKDKKLIENFEQRKLTESEYEKYIGYMYRDLLKKKEKSKESNQIKKQVIVLPEGMPEDIKNELKDNKEIHSVEIEDFLKKELKKNNGEIKISHIKNKFGDKSTFVTIFLKRLIKNYPTFQIIDNSENNNDTKKTTQSKNDKLISSIPSERSEKHKTERLKKNKLLFKLDDISKIEDLKSRITKYCDLFEELNHIFANRETFEPLVFDAITTHTNIEIEKDIIKTLNSIIQGNYRIEKTGLYRYIVYKFNRDSRRMLSYPNGEIFGIYPHEEYEKIINTPPPLGKFE